MRSKLVVVAALVLSACNPLPNGYGYVEAEGKHPANTQEHDYLSCWQQWVKDTYGMGEMAAGYRARRLHIDACMEQDGWKDIALDRYPY
jgi:hypothetical protein